MRQFRMNVYQSCLSCGDEDPPMKKTKKANSGKLMACDVALRLDLNTSPALLQVSKAKFVLDNIAFKPRCFPQRPRSKLNIILVS